MTQNEKWSRETKAIFYGILLYSIAGIVSLIVDPIESFVSVASNIAAIGGHNSDGANAFTSFSSSLQGLIIGGYVMLLFGLGGFRQILETNDAAAVGKIRTGVILGLIASVINMIPLIGWIIAGIINIVAFILMLMGYSGLKNSPTFPNNARRGAGQLFTSQILLLISGAIGLLLGWILLLGFVIHIFEGILNFIAFILLLSGWATIKNTQPEAPAFSMPGTPPATSN
jgi:uncharacterized membrane protein